jgi:lipopolysaccharide/colanic/teichoic acid biosynthesis glycosyltransferase
MINADNCHALPGVESSYTPSIPRRYLSSVGESSRRSTVSAVFKRSIDIIIAVSAAIILVPVLAVLIIVVSFDGGPAFYVQTRVGRGGRIFRCWKFRTMVVDADEKLMKLLASDETARQQYRTFWKLKDDPRITSVGRFLRRYSLDELPQILNVVAGQMSIVGPRPRSIKEMEFFESLMPGASLSYVSVKPGLTCLWQISGRNHLSLETKGWLDTLYAKNWSVSGDIAIITATLPAVISGQGAF